MTTERNPNALAASAPAYLSTGAKGVDPVPMSAAMPRIVLVQAMSAADVKAEFGEGAIVVKPDLLPLAEPFGEFTATPLFRWVSWQKWADVNDGESVSPIIDETTDPESATAKRARSRNTDERHEEYGTGKRKLAYRYFESLNLVVRVSGGPLDGLVAGLSFRSAGHKHGAKLFRHVDRFGAKGIPIYGHRVRFRAQGETNRNGQTYVVLAPLPADPPWTPEADLPALEKLHDGFAAVARDRSAPTVAADE